MAHNRLIDRSVSTAATAAGGALRGVFAGVGRLRPTAKPLHPRGVVLPATVHRHGARERFGVAWLDEPGTDAALVRFSRGGGLPDGLPDVLGIALRIEPKERPGDLLFATTGRGRVGRFLLRPRRASTVAAATYSTLQPYRTPTGPVLLAATPLAGAGATVRESADGSRADGSVADGTLIVLAVARPAGRWQQFGTVTVEGSQAATDAAISFDPFLNPVRGLDNYGWTRRLREGAYAAARRSRHSGDGDVRVSDRRRG